MFYAVSIVYFLLFISGKLSQIKSFVRKGDLHEQNFVKNITVFVNIGEMMLILLFSLTNLFINDKIMYDADKRCFVVSGVILYIIGRSN